MQLCKVFNTLFTDEEMAQMKRLVQGYVYI